jgi:NTP pyrophosphatase (non-canonical NTP hydrolase)
MAWESSSAAVRAFVRDRDWAKFHSPENLAKSIAIEAGELLECFQWSAEADQAEVRRELADVLIYSLLLADRIGADVDELIAAKIEENALKYPAERARGRSTKYDRL